MMPDLLSDEIDPNDIAIIGMGGRFPGAQDTTSFWENLKSGVESISFFAEDEVESSDLIPVNPKHPNYVGAGGVLEGIDLFDASFFHISAREAEWMDPQHRIFLECCVSTLEDAGYFSDVYDHPIAVYAGARTSTYLFSVLSELKSTAEIYQALIANDKDFLASRVSYKLNLRGESITVQTACSTSLVAVHLACQSLLIGQCDLALAGGVSINLPQKSGYIYQEGMVLSPDGHCRAFDARAGGTIAGNGVGIVALKRLADAVADRDTVRAVIKGSAINNDGAQKVGFMAPSVAGQADVIARAQAIAGVEPDSISYVEAHGTATPMGDVVEVAALCEAFRAARAKGFCALGSVKTNVGHLDVAAGVASLIKTVFALEHKQLPPSLHFERPNPKIDFANSPFHVNTALREWSSVQGPRRAGVSSFGIGGTNAHVVLQESPPRLPSGPARPWQLLVLSARSATALETATDNLAYYLRKHPDVELADVAYSLQVGRKQFAYRRAIPCRDVDMAIAAVESRDPNCVFTSHVNSPLPVVFMFPGQGSQHLNMARELYELEPVFRAHIDRCAMLLKPHIHMDFRDLLYPPAHCAEEMQAQLDQTVMAQPCLFAVEYALAKLWQVWGIEASACIGHSLGEYVAACLAGVFSLEEALMLVAARGRIMQQQPGGRMISVAMSEQALRPLLRNGIDLAVHNAPSLCVLSGQSDAIETLRVELTGRGIRCVDLNTSHAFHSAMMEIASVAFATYISRLKMHPPSAPYISNVSGNWITPQEATDPAYWGEHLRKTVRFSEGLSTLMQEVGGCLLEVGPGTVMANLANHNTQAGNKPLILSSLPNPRSEISPTQQMVTSVGHLWSTGASINWFEFNAEQKPHRIPLPTYPFERSSYWINVPVKVFDTAPQLPHNGTAQTNSIQPQRPVSRSVDGIRFVAPRNVIEERVAEIWRQILGLEGIGIHDNFYELGGDSLLMTQIFAHLNLQFADCLTLEEMLKNNTIADLSQILQQKLRPELSDTPEYYCAFEMRIGDEIATFYLTQEEYIQNDVPKEAINFRVL